MNSHKLAMFGILMALMLIVAACNGDDEDDAADVPEDDTTPEEVTPDEADTTPEVTEEEDETPEDGMTPEETPEDGMTPEETPENGMTPEETPEDGMTPEETPEDGADTGERLMVDVSLADMDIQLDFENGMAENGDPVTLPSGSITFQIMNDDDEFPHSLTIEPADAAEENGDDATPTGDAEMAEQELDEQLEPGDSTEWEVDLEPGDYVFYCPVGDHRDQGMEIEVTVEESES